MVRILRGDLDDRSGRFLDATADLDDLATRSRSLADDGLKLRLVVGS